MFCPGCGSEERQASQFCRACGIDLRVVRVSLERPDSVTESAITAREEIGRAIADKIRALDNAQDLKSVTNEVLPEIEKFLESPDEKRLRRVRMGVVGTAIGLGVWLPALALTSVAHSDTRGFLFMLVVMGAIAFALGLAYVVNGLAFTRPHQSVRDSSSDAALQELLDRGKAQPQLRAQTTSNLSLAGSSVTEHTTHHLKTGR